MDMQVVRNELAQKLKAAGFPQNTVYFWHSLISHDMKQWSEYRLQDYKPSSEFGMRVFAAPTTDELRGALLGVSYSIYDSYGNGVCIKDVYVRSKRVTPPLLASIDGNELPNLLAELWLWCIENEIIPKPTNA